MHVSSCVLVVDDDRNDVFLLRRGFHRAGLMADLFDLPDGVPALEYLRGSPPYDDRARFPFPDLLLLDLKMPRINGLNVLAWLAGRPDMKNLPALVLTSSSLQSDREIATKLGAREFLVKPTDPSDWVKLAQGLQQRWLAAKTGSHQIWNNQTLSQEAPPRLFQEPYAIADADVRGGLFG
jgi:CheY-like chemotaxis protein